MKPKLIKTEAENEAALTRLEEIFEAGPGTPEGDEAELLTALIKMYERKAYPMGTAGSHRVYQIPNGAGGAEGEGPDPLHWQCVQGLGSAGRKAGA